MSDLQTKTLDDGSTVEVSELRRDWNSKWNGVIGFLCGAGAVSVGLGFAASVVLMKPVNFMDTPVTSGIVTLMALYSGYSMGRKTARGSASLSGEAARKARQKNKQKPAA